MISSLFSLPPGTGHCTGSAPLLPPASSWLTPPQPCGAPQHDAAQHSTPQHDMLSGHTDDGQLRVCGTVLHPIHCCVDTTRLPTPSVSRKRRLYTHPATRATTKPTEQPACARNKQHNNTHLSLLLLLLAPLLAPLDALSLLTQLTTPHSRPGSRQRHNTTQHATEHKQQHHRRAAVSTHGLAQYSMHGQKHRQSWQLAKHCDRPL